MLFERTVGFYAAKMFDRDSDYLATRRQKGRSFTDKTAEIRAGIVKNYVIPFWGRYRLSKLTAKDIDRDLISAISVRDRRPLLGGEKNVIINIFSDIFQLAIADGYTGNNPVSGILKFSQAVKNQRGAIPKNEMKLLFPESHDDLIRIWGKQVYAVAFLVLRDTGLRPGELRALQWKDWHPDLRFFPITKAVESGKRDKIKGTKTGSVKPAVVSDQAARELEILRAIKKPSGRDKFIFSNRHNIPFSIDRIISNFKKGVIRAGLSRPAYTPYWLRHTFNTRMLEILPDETVRLLMGHATEAMTRHYYHPDIDSLRTEAKKIIENFDAVKDQWGA